MAPERAGHLSLAQASQRLGDSPELLFYRVRAGIVRGTRIGRFWYMPLDEVLDIERKRIDDVEFVDYVSERAFMHRETARYWCKRGKRYDFKTIYKVGRRTMISRSEADRFITWYMRR